MTPAVGRGRKRAAEPPLAAATDKSAKVLKAEKIVEEKEKPNVATPPPVAVKTTPPKSTAKIVKKNGKD